MYKKVSIPRPLGAPAAGDATGHGERQPALVQLQRPEPLNCFYGSAKGRGTNRRSMEPAPAPKDAWKSGLLQASLGMTAAAPSLSIPSMQLVPSMPSMAATEPSATTSSSASGAEHGRAVHDPLGERATETAEPKRTATRSPRRAEASSPEVPSQSDPESVRHRASEGSVEPAPVVPNAWKSGLLQASMGLATELRSPTVPETSATEPVTLSASVSTPIENVWTSRRRRAEAKAAQSSIATGRSPSKQATPSTSATLTHAQHRSATKHTHDPVTPQAEEGTGHGTPLALEVDNAIKGQAMTQVAERPIPEESLFTAAPNAWETGRLKLTPSSEARVIRRAKPAAAAAHSGKGISASPDRPSDAPRRNPKTGPIAVDATMAPSTQSAPVDPRAIEPQTITEIPEARDTGDRSSTVSPSSSALGAWGSGRLKLAPSAQARVIHRARRAVSPAMTESNMASPSLKEASDTRGRHVAGRRSLDDSQERGHIGHSETSQPSLPAAPGENAWMRKPKIVPEREAIVVPRQVEDGKVSRKLQGRTPSPEAVSALGIIKNTLAVSLAGQVHDGLLFRAVYKNAKLTPVEDVLWLMEACRDDEVFDAMPDADVETIFNRAMIRSIKSHPRVALDLFDCAKGIRDGAPLGDRLFSAYLFACKAGIEEALANREKARAQASDEFSHKATAETESAFDIQYFLQRAEERMKDLPRYGSEQSLACYRTMFIVKHLGIADPEQRDQALETLVQSAIDVGLLRRRLKTTRDGDGRVFMDFHTNALLTPDAFSSQVPEEERKHINSVSAPMAEAIFRFHSRRDAIPPDVHMIVGRHGKNKVSDVIYRAMCDLGMDPVRPVVNGGEGMWCDRPYAQILPTKAEPPVHGMPPFAVDASPERPATHGVLEDLETTATPSEGPALDSAPSEARTGESRYHTLERTTQNDDAQGSREARPSAPAEPARNAAPGAIHAHTPPPLTPVPDAPSQVPSASAKPATHTPGAGQILLPSQLPQGAGVPDAHRGAVPAMPMSTLNALACSKLHDASTSPADAGAPRAITPTVQPAQTTPTAEMIHVEMMSKRGNLEIRDYEKWVDACAAGSPHLQATLPKVIGFAMQSKAIGNGSDMATLGVKAIAGSSSRHAYEINSRIEREFGVSPSESERLRDAVLQAHLRECGITTPISVLRELAASGAFWTGQQFGQATATAEALGDARSAIQLCALDRDVSRALRNIQAIRSELTAYDRQAIHDLISIAESAGDARSAIRLSALNGDAPRAIRNFTAIRSELTADDREVMDDLISTCASGGQTAVLSGFVAIGEAKGIFHEGSGYRQDLDTLFFQDMAIYRGTTPYPKPRAVNKDVAIGLLEHHIDQGNLVPGSLIDFVRDETLRLAIHQRLAQHGLKAAPAASDASLLEVHEAGDRA